MPNIAGFATLPQSERWIFQYWFAGQLPVGRENPSIRSWLSDLGINDEPSHYSILDAAVARLLVGWEAGQFTRARTSEPSRDRESFPSRSLLSINWADSGPGVSWPASYNLFFLPPFERYVVVTSADEESFGYRDFALGHFSPKEDVLLASERIIIANWATLMAEYNQEKWCECWAGELVTVAEAQRWADQVWGSDYNDDEPEEEEEEEEESE